jgi:dihydropteroate synthase
MPDCAKLAAPIVCGRHRLCFTGRTLVMGIINTSPDSFSGDGVDAETPAVVEQARSFAAAGADILDIGGQSTRPGSDEVSVEEELRRTIAAIRAIAVELDLPISIDTSRPQVAEAAVEAGAGFINDVYALRREGMIQVAADSGAAVCLMHMQGEPRTMQQQPNYDDVIGDVRDFLQQRIAAAVAGGIAESQIVLDPGFGFGKTVGHNLEIIRHLRELTLLGRPLLIGPSRKSTIGTVLNQPDPQQRLWGTAAVCAIAIANGAAMIRVHDVEQMVQVARMSDAVLHGWQE